MIKQDFLTLPEFHYNSLPADEDAALDGRKNKF
jgi:hypothetical protein